MSPKIMMIAFGVALSASVGIAVQDPPRKLTAAVRGEVAVEVTAPDTKVGSTDVITTMRVRNAASGPIAGLQISETWFKGEAAVSGDIYRHPRPFQVGEVIEVRFSVPRSRIVGARNRYDFRHANGTIKPKTVPRLDLPKPAKPTN